MIKQLIARSKDSVQSMRKRLIGELEDLRRLRIEVDQLRSMLELGRQAPTSFALRRQAPEYSAVWSKANPLVTVCIGTYNRAELLVERSLKSVLAQVHRNLQVIVVGDHCTDDTEKRISQIRDSRLTFINLPERGKYPEAPEWRWMVAGTVPVNCALALAEGDFVTHLDDDDEHSPERTTSLLELVQSERADLAWHPFWAEKPEGGWKLNEAKEFRFQGVSTSSVLYHRWFAQIPWDLEAYLYGEPGDWNRFRKFRYLGAKVVRHPEPFLRHYRERNQKRTHHGH